MLDLLLLVFGLIALFKGEFKISKNRLDLRSKRF